VLVRNQQCRLTELHKFCSVFCFLGDYESAGNPTNASEGSLGPRGVNPRGRPANHICAAIERRVCINLRECRECRVPRRHMPQSFRALHPHNRRKQELDMLISTKSGAPEKDRNASVSAAEVMGRVVPHDQSSARSESTTKAGTASCIGSDMSIVGKIECNGPAQVLGRIEGELRASDLLISDGAQVEGNIIAQGVTVCGRVKGTIRAVRVKLQNGGAVEGDIFHRSLSIDENSQFEGSSRRVENPTEPSSSVDAKGPQKSPQKKDLAPSIDAELTEGPKP
jgi:cytoskeletal protein CcmA (bactofilin family)